MGMIEEVQDRGLGLPLGIGLAVAAISAGPKIVEAGRPVMKSVIKGYLAVHTKMREMMAETGEKMQDVYAEAKHEFDEEGKTMMKAEASRPKTSAKPKTAETRKTEHESAETGAKKEGE